MHTQTQFIPFLKSLLQPTCDIEHIRLQITNAFNFIFKNEFQNITENEIVYIEHEQKQYEYKVNSLKTELQQIIESQTEERAKYYIQRLIKSILTVKTSKINDINLNKWKEYPNIETDSLWILQNRDNTKGHSAHYWGNFVPQIPNQLIQRYTQAGDWVLDTFLGSGTTLIECNYLNRNGVGIEINETVANNTAHYLQQLHNPTKNTQNIVIHGDSTSLNYAQTLQQYGVQKVQLVLMHPPYWDIIKFGNDTNDLSNANSLHDFLQLFTQILQQAHSVLEKKRYLAIIIGDKYANGEWIPLGFYCMQAAMNNGFLLKSTVVKNYDETRAKRQQKEIWRYRALVGGFYVFKHEYIFIFQKK